MPFVLILFGCTNQPKEQSESAVSNEITEIQKKDSLVELQGIWAEDSEGDAYFIIRNDSIFSVDDRSGVPFSVRDDSLIVTYNWGTVRHFILNLTMDSLIIRNEDASEVRLIKR